MRTQRFCPSHLRIFREFFQLPQNAAGVHSLSTTSLHRRPPGRGRRPYRAQTKELCQVALVKCVPGDLITPIFVLAEVRSTMFAFAYRRRQRIRFRVCANDKLSGISDASRANSSLRCLFFLCPRRQQFVDSFDVARLCMYAKESSGRHLSILTSFGT